jgi:hypothetical protein
VFPDDLSHFAAGCKEAIKARNSARAGNATAGGPVEKLAQTAASAIHAGMPTAFPADISQTSQSPCWRRIRRKTGKLDPNKLHHG